MLRLHFLIILLMALSVCRTTFADGLLHSIPQDGGWARYRVELKDSALPNAASRPISIKVSVVGTAMIDGESCRWIEVDLQRKGQKLTETEVFKLLIPEKHLGEGDSVEPFQHLVQVWLRQSGPNSPAPEQIKEFKNDSNVQNLRLFLQDVFNSIKKMDGVKVENESEQQLHKVMVDGPKGKVECDGVKKSGKFSRGEMRGDVEYTIYYHKDSPFGVAATNAKFTMKEGDKVVASHEVQLTLTEYGNDAVSAIPDVR